MVVLAVTLGVLIGAAAGAVDDVRGWQTLRWEMTAAEARQALEAAGYTLEPDSGRYRATYAPFATRPAIGGQDYQATFQFADDTRRLIQVALRARTAPHPAGGADRDMLDRLREQYGPPHSTARRPRPTAVWTFPTTTITLHGPVSSSDMTTLYEVTLIDPYTASSTTLRTLLPDWALEGGIEAMLERLGDPGGRAHIRQEMTGGSPILARGLGWEDIMIASSPARPEAEGRRLADLGRAWNVDPLDAAMDLLVAERGKGYIILFQLDEADLRRALVHPEVMIGSDGSSLAVDGELGAGKPHPRSYGTFPRVLGRYVRDESLLSLEEAVRKMTSLPARRLGLADRGVLAVGAKADVVGFDAERVEDRATYEAPHHYATGIPYVLVNGRVVIDGSAHTGVLPGVLLTPAARTHP